MEHVDPAVGPVEDGAEGGEEELAGLPSHAIAVGELHRDHLAAEGQRCAIQEIVVGAGRVRRQGVDLVQVRVVVRRRPPQALVEPADDPERAAEPEVTVEVDDAGHRDVGLVVAGVPGEVRVPDQDRVTRLRPRGGQGPRVRPHVRVRLRRRRGQPRPDPRCLPRRGSLRLLRPPLQPLQEGAHVAGVRPGDAPGMDVVAVESGGHPVGERLRVQLDVAIHAFGEPFQDGPDVAGESMVGLHRAGVPAPAHGVPVDARRPRPARPLAPGPDQPLHHVHPVVLHLDPAHGEGRGPEALGPDVGHAVGGAADHDLLGQVGVRGVLGGGRRGGQAQPESEEEQERSADGRAHEASAVEVIPGSAEGR